MLDLKARARPWGWSDQHWDSQTAAIALRRNQALEWRRNLLVAARFGP